ncbi:MAG: endolytic transglycosylase MltG [Lachnospiraceae bacterium]|nr:endolytic transglycosylase MltG [Lachnospiraceae bacterium]
MDNESGVKRIADILSGFAGRVIVIALMVLVIFVAVRFSFGFGHSIFYQSPAEAPPGRDVELTIEKGASIDELAEQLYEDGVITNELAFRIQGRLYKVNFYPGTYTLNTSMTVKEILQAIDMTEAEYEESKAAAQAAGEGADGVVGGGSEGE